MAQYKYQTRNDFLSAFRSKYPEYNSVEDDLLYDRVIQKFPEYQQQIAENYQEPELNLDTDTYPTADEKNFFTGLGEIFSKDFYKLIPFVRDAEFFELKDMLSASERLKNGTASQEDMVKLREWATDEERPSSWGYQTLMLLAHIPAYAVEFGALSTLSGGWAGFAKAGAGKAARTAAKQGLKRTLLKASEKKGIGIVAKGAIKAGTAAKATAGALGDTAGGQAVRIAGQKVNGALGSIMARGANLVGAKNAAGRSVGITSARLAKAKAIAHSGGRDGFIKALAKAGEGSAIKGAIKEGGATLGLGFGEAAMRTALRAPQSIINAQRRMLPELQTAEGLDGEMVIELVDDGEDLLPALAKGFGDMGIEMFSETVGNSLGLADRLMGGHIFRAGVKSSLKATDGKLHNIALKTPILRRYLDMLIAKGTPANAAYKAAKEKLANYGWNGIVEEMFEERVGDVMRGATGIQDNWFPTPEQLASEAVAFALFGAMGTAAHEAKKLTILGGSGLETSRRNKEAIELNEGGVMVEGEYEEHVDGIYETLIEERKNPDPLTKLLRKIEIFGHKPFAGYARAGSMEALINETYGQDLVMFVGAEIEKGSSKEEVRKSSQKFIDHMLKQHGAWVVKTPEQKDSVIEMIDSGEIEFVSNPKSQYYKISKEAYEKNPEAIKDSLGENGIIVFDKKGWDSLQRTTEFVTVFEAEEFKVQPGSEEFEANLDKYAKIFRTSDRQRIEGLYKVIHTAMNSSHTRERLGLQFAYAPVAAVEGTGSELTGITGYETENPNEKEIFLINGFNEDGVVVINRLTTFTGLAEEIIEASIKETIANNGDLNTQTKTLAETVRNHLPQDLQGYDFVDILSKTYLSTHLGLTAGHRAKDWANVSLPENVAEALGRMINGAVGQKVIEALATGIQMEVAQEAEKEQEEAKEAPKSTQERETAPEPTESIEKETKPTESKKEAPKDTSTKGPVQQATEQFLEEEISLEDLKQVAVDNMTKKQGAEEKAEIRRLLRIIRAEYESEDQRIADIEEVLFSKIGFLSFAGNVHTIEEGMSKEDVIGLLINDNIVDGLNDQLRFGNTDIANLSQSIITRAIDTVYGRNRGIQLLYDLIHTPEDRAHLKKVINGGEIAFDAFMRVDSMSDDLRTLRDIMRTNFANNQKEGVETLKSIVKRYENIQLLPVVAIQNGKLVTLNTRNLEIRVADQVRRRIPVILGNMRATEEASARQNLLNWLESASNEKQMIEMLATISGQKYSLIARSMKSGPIKYFYNKLVTAVREGVKNDLPMNQIFSSIDTVMTKLKYSKTKLSFPGFLSLFGGTQEYGVQFRNVDGHLEMSFRENSHMVEAAAVLAEDFGWKTPETALVMFNGSRNKRKGKNARKIHGEALTEELFKLFTESNEKGFYLQTLGRMGGKNQVYLVQAPRYSDEALVDAVNEHYEDISGNLPKEQLLEMIQTMKEQSDPKTKNRTRFEIHFALNLARIKPRLHGITEGLSLEDLNKRASQIPTGGIALEGKPVNVIVVEDPKEFIDGKLIEMFDGQVIYTGEFGKRFASSMGSHYMNGQKSENSIKPNIFYIDENGVRRQIKGAWKNVDALQNHPDYKALKKFLDSMKGEVDAIVFSSAAKVGYKSDTTMGFLKKDENGNYEVNYDADINLTQIPADEFISVQNLNFSSQSSLKKDSKQKNTDTIHGTYSDQVAELHEQNMQDLLDMIDTDSINRLLSDSVLALQQELQSFKERNQLTGNAQQVLNRFLHTLRPEERYNNYVDREEGDENRLLESDAYYVVAELIHELSWTTEADKDYFRVVKDALANNQSEYDPAVSGFIEGMKSRLLQRMIDRKQRRTLAQKVSAGSMYIPSFEKDPATGKIRLPWIMTYTQGVRYAERFDTKKEAIKYARQFDDMRVIENGKLTDKVKTWEIRTPAEAKELGMDGWVVPGGYVFESRIPAENMQSHIPHRLWMAPGSVRLYGNQGNISITAQDISRRKGEDYDGDTGFQYVMFENPRSELEYRRNLALMLQAEDYYDPAFQEAVMNSVDAEMFSDLPAMRKLTPEQMKQRHIYWNTTEGQEWLSESSSTSLDALARVASNIKFYDIAQKLGFGISEQIEFNTPAGWVRVNFSRQDVGKLTPQEILFRKRYYGTLLVNLTVDDISHPQMYAMGMNEITAPMMQALLALDTSIKDEAGFRKRMNAIIELMHSGPIKAYVKARRHMQSLDYNARKEQRVNGKWLSNEAMVKKLMLEELGLKYETADVKSVMNLHRLMEDINAISQTMDTMYEAPKSSAEFMLREEGLKKLETNNFKVVNAEGAMESGELNIHLRPIKTSLEKMEQMVFNKSPLLSQTGREIYNGLKEHQKRDEAFLQHTEKTIARVLMSHAIDINSDIEAMNFEVFTESLIDQIKAIRERGANVFLDLLQSDYLESGEKIISVNKGYTGNAPEMSEALLERARQDFEKLDSELQRRLMLYAVQVYGVNETIWNGSFFPLVGRVQREQISKEYEKELDEFNADNRLWIKDLLLKPKGKYKQNYIEQTNWTFGSIYTGNLMASIDVIGEKVEKPTPKKAATKLVMSEELNARDEVISAGLQSAIREIGGEAIEEKTFEDLLDEAIAAHAEAQKEAVEEVNRAALEELQERKPSLDKMIGSDGANFSISRLHETLAKESALFMAGASGAHKIWMRNMDKHQAERIIGRLYRVLWEVGVGARQDIYKGRKLTEEQKQRGLDVLAAITAQISGTETVVTGYVSEKLSIEDAIRRLIEIEVKSLPEQARMSDPAKHPQMQKALRQAIAEGLIESNAAKAKTLGGMMEMLIEADVKRWVKKQKNKEDKELLVPVKSPKIHAMTASEILADYENTKEDWMIDSAELKQEIQEQFELARVRANQDESAEDELIAHRENYIPIYYASQDIRKGLRSNTVNEGFVAAESRKGDYNDYATAAQHGRIPVSTNAAELFEIWTRQTSNHKMLASAWQTILMATDPDGSTIIIPEFASQSSRQIISEGMIHAYAQKLAYFNGESLKGMPPRDYVASKVPTASSEYTRIETNVKSMPYVWAKKGNSENLVKMTVGAKKEGKYWKHWERMVGWTKFMAIGFPWMSTFHYAALLESEIASRGLKDSSAWNPAKAYKEFQGFRKDLEKNPESARKWFQWGLTATLENPDYAQGVVDEDLEWISNRLKENKHKWMASKVDGFREMKKNWDTRLWIRFHGPLKLWVAEGLLNTERERWQQENPNKIFPEDKYGREIAELVDHMFGGINNNRYLWKTPVATQVTHSVFFAKDWTEAALGIAGAGNIPGLGNIIGGNSEIQNRIRYTKYWPAFGAIVMFGIPQFLQAAIWAITRPVGDDDDEPFTFLNEHDRRTWIDVTPLVRMIDPRDKPDERRVYLRWAKQGYEIGDWVTDPLETAGHKMSVPLKWAYEHMSGRSVGGWDMAFKDHDFFGVLQAQGSFRKSRVGDTAMRFIPFTVQDIIKGRPTAWFAKAKSGKHGWYASKQLTELYLGYVSGINWNQTKNHEKNVLLIASDILTAAEKNGYDAITVQKEALQNARAELYISLEEAIHMKNMKKAEGIALRLHALEGSAYKLKKLYKANPVLIANSEPS
jgi:hypothetical protein